MSVPKRINVAVNAETIEILERTIARDGISPPSPPGRPTVTDRTHACPGKCGQQINLAEDEEPANVPARPYAEIRRNDGQQDRVGQVLATDDTETPVWVAYLFGRAIGWFRR